MTAPDFEALRAARNASLRAELKRISEETGWPLAEIRVNHDDDACYCACANGGPCEHRWDGPDWTSEDQLCISSTCSRCGTTAFSHDLWVHP